MRVRSTLMTMTTAAALMTGLLAPAAAAQAEPVGSGAWGERGDTLVMPLQKILAEMPVAEESRTGYERTKFKHWIDADKNRCNTRAEILLAEAVLTPQKDTQCKISGGRWYSAYDDTYIDGPSKIDIDHLIPLAEAWDSGASAWSAQERMAYANDLDDSRALIAVSAKTNRSKADQDPTTWMPPAEVDHCAYVTEWAAVKVRWQLTVDPAEANALAQTTVTCSNVPVKVTLAR
ncbi:HNH endonuclease family protein [Streptomyces sp. NPDC004111]|uniref:HNH endonuclease family protein n=1 Tax=Streptomyces sp. NPDC004111 TaxID=3364690 RepID=UPI0036B4DDEE